MATFGSTRDAAWRCRPGHPPVRHRLHPRYGRPDNGSNARWPGLRRHGRHCGRQGGWGIGRWHLGYVAHLRASPGCHWGCGNTSWFRPRVAYLTQGLVMVSPSGRWGIAWEVFAPNPFPAPELDYPHGPSGTCGPPVPWANQGPQGQGIVGQIRVNVMFCFPHFCFFFSNGAFRRWSSWLPLVFPYVYCISPSNLSICIMFVSMLPALGMNPREHRDKGRPTSPTFTPAVSARCPDSVAYPAAPRPIDEQFAQ
ncbi:hypothetical protein BCR44DRAFT_407863 [Catenaria anguillulae PL171]|uniref:Uncharacterized protein n=1 Tax=Catenaria anguillulae PL171 TaxID=765915 RepID=A0A1Y2HW33_9FUNG|nr:hypothetical protein BCR44DRAFT_407863 [Catenaria anguillulae PL171]